MTIDPDRLATANYVLDVITPGCRLEYARGFFLCWQETWGEGRTRRLRWVPQSRGSDYPSISKRVPFGGTCCCAVMELTRWCRGLPVRPRETWEYWCGRSVGMTPLALQIVTAAGWPETVPCVFCGRPLGRGVEWDHFDRDGWPVGPGCYRTGGCDGKPPEGKG